MIFFFRAGGVEVHDGFHDTQGRTADVVLSTVKSALSSSGYKKVLVTGMFSNSSSFPLVPDTQYHCHLGHSLGGAVALLDATMLKMQIPSVEIDLVTFGMPRVGNQKFADMIDSIVSSTSEPSLI